MLCQIVNVKGCKAECDAFYKKPEWGTCEAYLKKHTKLQVSLQVSLLYYGHTLVRKQLKMQPGHLQGFYQVVNATQPEGPILPLSDEGAPQGLRLFGAIQRKMLSFLLHDPSMYTV